MFSFNNFNLITILEINTWFSLILLLLLVFLLIFYSFYIKIFLFYNHLLIVFLNFLFYFFLIYRRLSEFFFFHTPLIITSTFGSFKTSPSNSSIYLMKGSNSNPEESKSSVKSNSSPSEQGAKKLARILEKRYTNNMSSFFENSKRSEKRAKKEETKKLSFDELMEIIKSSQINSSIEPPKTNHRALPTQLVKDPDLKPKESLKKTEKLTFTFYNSEEGYSSNYDTFFKESDYFKKKNETKLVTPVPFVEVLKDNDFLEENKLSLPPKIDDSSRRNWNFPLNKGISEKFKIKKDVLMAYYRSWIERIIRLVRLLTGNLLFYLIDPTYAYKNRISLSNLSDLEWYNLLVSFFINKFISFFTISFPSLVLVFLVYLFNERYGEDMRHTFDLAQKTSHRSKLKPGILFKLFNNKWFMRWFLDTPSHFARFFGNNIYFRTFSSPNRLWSFLSLIDRMQNVLRGYFRR